MNTLELKLKNYFGDGVLIPQQGRGNSEVYVYRTDGNSFFIKKYPKDSLMDRRKSEESMYKIYSSIESIKKYIPGFIYGNHEENFNAFELLVAMGSSSFEMHSNAYLDFLNEIINIPLKEVSIQNAKESVFCISDLQKQILSRRNSLVGLNNNILNKYIYTKFDPIFNKINFSDFIINEKIISPSDFGSHNAIFTDTGLKFIDFEYGGIDTKYKLFSDIHWHVGFDISILNRFKLIDEFIKSDEKKQFMKVNQLMGLKWSLLVLNEFFPELYEKRLKANASELSMNQYQFSQLSKSESLLERVNSADCLC